MREVVVMAVAKKYNVFRSGKLIGEYTAVDAAQIRMFRWNRSGVRA